MSPSAVFREPPHHTRPYSRPEKLLQVNGHTFVADVSGALFWPDEKLLVVADLHLEKASAFATRRVFLPPYDTSATIGRLADVIRRFAPKRVIALGDSFHDRDGSARLSTPDLGRLVELQAGRDWIWIAGNHDPAPPAGLGGEHVASVDLRSIRFCHEPRLRPHIGEIAGHLHPVVVVGGRGGAVRRRCFASDGARCILPAFGAYAGGLNLLDTAFHALLDWESARALVLGREDVYRVSHRQCLADRLTADLSWR